jgi:hypothetical protein
MLAKGDCMQKAFPRQVYFESQSQNKNKFDASAELQIRGGAQ